MNVRSAMQVGQDILKQYGVKHTKELALLLIKSLYPPMSMWKYVNSTSSANHIDICLKFMFHRTHAKLVQRSFVKSDAMMADLLMKALPAPKISGLRGMFELKGLRANCKNHHR